jgi:hypothetical protein
MPAIRDGAGPAALGRFITWNPNRGQILRCTQSSPFAFREVEVNRLHRLGLTSIHVDQ